MHAATSALLFILIWCPVSRAFPAAAMDQETESDDTRHILGSSVVTSVSVVMDLGNGSQKYYADSTGRPVPKPADSSNLASPPSLMHPDRYEFYTFNDEGDLVKRLMTLEEIQSLIAGESVEIGSDLPGYDHEEQTVEEKLPAFFFLPRPIEQTQDWSPPAVDNVVAKVQNILTQMRNSTIDASMNEPSWALLPSSAKPTITTDVPMITEKIPFGQTMNDVIKITTVRIPVTEQQTPVTTEKYTITTQKITTPQKTTTQKVTTPEKITTAQKVSTTEKLTTPQKITTTTEKISTQQKYPPPFPASNYVEYELQKVTKKPVVSSSMPPTDAIPMKPTQASIAPLINEINENEFEFATFFPIFPEKIANDEMQSVIKTEAPTTVKVSTTTTSTTTKVTDAPPATIKVTDTTPTTIKVTDTPSTTVKVTYPPPTTVKIPVTTTTFRITTPRPTTRRPIVTNKIPVFSSTKIPESGITTEIPPPVKFTKTTTSNGLTTLVYTTQRTRTTTVPSTSTQRVTPSTTLLQRTTTTTVPTTVAQRTTVLPTTVTKKATIPTFETTERTTQKPVTKYSITQKPTTQEQTSTTQRITTNTPTMQPLTGSGYFFLLNRTATPTTVSYDETPESNTITTVTMAPVFNRTTTMKIPLSSTQIVSILKESLSTVPPFKKTATVADSNKVTVSTKKPILIPVADFVPDVIPQEMINNMMHDLVTNLPSSTKPNMTKVHNTTSTANPMNEAISSSSTSKPQVTVTLINKISTPSEIKVPSNSNNSIKKPIVSSNMKPQLDSEVTFNKPHTNASNKPAVNNTFNTTKTDVTKPPAQTIPTGTTQKLPGSGFYVTSATTKKPAETTTEKAFTTSHPEKISTFIPQVTANLNKYKQNSTHVKKPSVATASPIYTTQKMTSNSPASTPTSTVKSTTNAAVTMLKTVTNSEQNLDKPTTKVPEIIAKTSVKPLDKITTKMPEPTISNAALVTEKIPSKLPSTVSLPSTVKSVSSTTLSTPTTRTTHKPSPKLTTLKPVPTTMSPQVIYQSDNLLDRNTVLLAESLVKNTQFNSAAINAVEKSSVVNASEDSMTSKTSDIDLTSEYSTLLELVTENAKPSTQYVPVSLEQPNKTKKPQKPSKPSDLLELLSEITSDFESEINESQDSTDSPSGTTYFEIPFISAFSGDGEDTTNPSSGSTEYINHEMFKIPWDSSEESTEIVKPNKVPSSTQKPILFNVKPQVLKPYKPEYAKPADKPNEFVMHINSNTGMFETVPMKVPTAVDPFLKPETGFFEKVALTNAKKPMTEAEIQADIDAHQALFLNLHKEVMHKLTTSDGKITDAPPTFDKESTEKIPNLSSTTLKYPSNSLKPLSTSITPQITQSVSLSSEENDASKESFEKLTTLLPVKNKNSPSTENNWQSYTENPPSFSEESFESLESMESMENSSSNEQTSSEENSSPQYGITTEHQLNSHLEGNTETIPDLEVSWQEPPEVIWTAKPGEKPWAPISEVIPNTEISTLVPVKTSPKPSKTTMTVKVKPSTTFVSTSIDKTTESSANNEIKLVTISDFLKTESVPSEYTVSSSEGSTASWVTKFPSSSESTTQKLSAASLVTKRPATFDATTQKISSSMMTKITTSSLNTQKVTSVPKSTLTPSATKPSTQQVRVSTVTPKPQSQITTQKTTVTKSPTTIYTTSSGKPIAVSKPVSSSSVEMELVSSSKPSEHKATTSPVKYNENNFTPLYERQTGNTKSEIETTEKARHPDKPELLSDEMELISSSNFEDEILPVTPSIKPSMQQNYYGPEVPLEHAPPNNLGLEATTVALDEDIRRFIDLNNDVAIRLFKHVTSEHDKRRSIALSPFGATSLLAMVFLGARGQTSAQMNDFLPFDDMITFNPHLVMRNITDSVIMSPDLQAAAIVRQLYSQQANAELLDFYKARVGAFYDGLVQEVDFEDVSEIVRQHTNELVRTQTSQHVPEFLSKTATLRLRPPLAALSANVFQMQCKNMVSQSRLPDLQFNTDRPGVQHSLFSSVWTGQFLMGYDAGLDATAVEIPHSSSPGNALTSTVFVMPGKPNSRGGTPLLARLEARLISRRAWSGLLRNLMRSKVVMDIQVPRFEHRSVLNLTIPLRRMGLKDLFNAETADLKGINGISDLYLTDLMQVNAFSACSDSSAEGHVETYPTSRRTGRVSGRQDDDEEEWKFTQYTHLPLALRPRQARIPSTASDIPRLRLDRPFLYIVRHNPTGMILHIGRFNPRFNS